MESVTFQEDTWYKSGSSWLTVCPWGIRRALNWAKGQYSKLKGEPKIYITENGFSDKLGNLDDLQRIYYYKHYINQVNFTIASYLQKLLYPNQKISIQIGRSLSELQVLKAVKLDEVNVAGYYAWSLMDNFEWARGYSEHFGLHYVDMMSDERTRKPKESSRYFAKLAKNNGFTENMGPCQNQTVTLNMF